MDLCSSFYGGFPDSRSNCPRPFLVRIPRSHKIRTQIPTLPLPWHPCFEGEISPTAPKQQRPATQLIADPPPRRSSRHAKPPTKLTYDVLGENTSPAAHFAFLSQIEPSIAADLELASAYKAINTNPDLLIFDQAMACEPEERERWIQSACKEIQTLESINCWIEVPLSEATKDPSRHMGISSQAYP